MSTRTITKNNSGSSAYNNNYCTINKNNNTSSSCCSVCTAPIKMMGAGSDNNSGAARVCSLRCSWKTKQQCVQCGRQVKDEKLPFADHPHFKIFCGALCLDEARRGNWCIACGVKQVTTQGNSRCSHECMSVDVPLTESPFPSRRTTPGEGEKGNTSSSSNTNTTTTNNNNHNNNNYNNNNNNNNNINHQQQYTTNNSNNNNSNPSTTQLSRRASFSSTVSSSSTGCGFNNNGYQQQQQQQMFYHQHNNNNHQNHHHHHQPMMQERKPNSRDSQPHHHHHHHHHPHSSTSTSSSSRVTCSPVQPGSKLWDRITTPFHRSGLQCYQVIQVHNSVADKKAYNAYRLSVDQNLSSKGIKKYGFGGEGNEHKRFVPLMAGCGGHLYGLRLASQLPTSQHSSSSAANHKEIGCDIEGYPFVCQDPSCDVCRILESGLKLTSVTGRSSHFSVPTLDSVLPWCQDASASTPSSSSNNNNNSSTLNSTSSSSSTNNLPKFQAAALIRTVLGNVHIVNDFESVPESQAPQGYDSVVCVDNNNTSNNNNQPRTDSAFNYNDRGVLCEYVVLFSS